MDITAQHEEESLGIKVYTPTQNNNNNNEPNPLSSSSSFTTAAPPQHKKRRIVAKGVQKTLSKTSLLANFLPTGTLLTFEMVLPSIYHNGECSHVATLMTHVLLTLCACSCFFFHFTDSFRGPDGNVYYGFVTLKGLAVFKPGLGVEVPKDDKYKVGLSDVVHACMSVLVFVAIAFSDHRVTKCLFAGHEKEVHEVMESFPLMVGIVCSGLFLVFPTTRVGLGCMPS